MKTNVILDALEAQYCSGKQNGWHWVPVQSHNHKVRFVEL